VNFSRCAVPPLLAFAAALALPRAAVADLFSPGELSQPHAYLEGISHCTSCHVAGEQLSPAACLNCHKELAPEIAGFRGLHGRIPEEKRACQTCHREHQGRGFALIDWGGSKKQFDHLRAGYKLDGKHARLECEKCHDPRRIADPAVRSMLQEKPGKKTFLGLGTRCNQCHFDEHRGQLDQDCARCHDAAAFKPARFQHDKAAYHLEGKHAKVACEKCHPRAPDPSFDPGAFPPPVKPDVARYKPVPFASCSDCHKDPHLGRLGPACANCHTLAGWLVVRDLGKERSFHDKSRYPLRGAHLTVACQACHGPAPGKPPRFRNMAFKSCMDCHADAHLGQLTPPEPGKPTCDACHTVETFASPSYGLERHQKSRYPLQGAHRAVSCGECHKDDPKLRSKIPESTVRFLVASHRKPLYSIARFHVAGPLDRCETCHADPHAGQFAERVKKDGCAGCHDLAVSFTKTRFDHQRDSRFKLDGAHAKAACGSCHGKVRIKGGVAVRYKGLATTCAGCHPDSHAGQFAPRRGAPTDCGRCHSTESFKKTTFVHAPPFTDFRLLGMHEKTACEKCHPPVEVAPGAKSRRYKPLPRECEGCHADFHKGAFGGYEP
jgi:hypothetical protein